MGVMPLEPLDYRLDRYLSMGFEHVQAVELANERAPSGGYIYWSDVKCVLESCKDHKLTVAVFCGYPTDVAAILGV